MSNPSRWLLLPKQGGGTTQPNVNPTPTTKQQAQCQSLQDLKRHALSYCKDNHTHIMKDADWKTIEEERPDLFEEAVAGVVAESDCAGAHEECLKRGGKRFEIERNSSTADHVGMGGSERQP